MTSPALIAEIRNFAEIARRFGLTDVYADLIQDANELAERRKGTMANQQPRRAAEGILETENFTEWATRRGREIQEDSVRRGQKAPPLDVAMVQAAAEQPEAYREHTDQVRFWKPGYMRH